MAIPSDSRRQGARKTRWRACDAVGKSQGRNDRSQARRRRFVAASLADDLGGDRSDLETLCKTGSI